MKTSLTDDRRMLKMNKKKNDGPGRSVGDGDSDRSQAILWTFTSTFAGIVETQMRLGRPLPATPVQLSNLVLGL